MPRKKYPTIEDPKTTPELKSTTKTQLQKVAKSRGLSGYSKLNKEELVQFLRNKKVTSKSKSSSRSRSRSASRSASRSESRSSSKSSSASPKDLYFGVDLDQIPIYSITPEAPPYESPKSKSKTPPPPYQSPSPKQKTPSPKQKSKSPEKYIRKIGPPSDLEKYGLIKELGKGKYGATYSARNLNKKQDEKDYYAVKVLVQSRDDNDWLKETKCLINVLEICTDVGILCYKDSFVFANPKPNAKFDLEFVIVSDLLEGYQNLNSFLADPQTYEPYGLTEDEAFDIYQQVVDIKNALTELCINHSDLHLENIMINPKTLEIKVIDLGRCQTPQEEIKEWGVGSDKWNLYSDEARFVQLRRALYNASHDSDHLHLQWPGGEPDDFFSQIKIDPSIPGCSRKSLPVLIKKQLNENLTKLRAQGVKVWSSFY